MTIYTTKSGDKWDQIAKAVYGDESYAAFLMKNNQKLIDYFIFPAGINVCIADKPEETTSFPEWRS